MTVGVYTHPACLFHDPGPGHPESPARLRRVMAVLDTPPFAALPRFEAPMATEAQIARAHPGGYFSAIVGLEPEQGERASLDADTHLNRGSVAAALCAAGGAAAAVDGVLSGAMRHAFVAVRPPGHHAEPDRAMGFCLFNSVAVAALHARDRWGLRRIAVLDFDVHHGNGTQAMFAPDAHLFYGSTHQSPCYPGTGLRSDRGVAGNICNRPLAPDSGSAAFRAAWDEILAELARFSPDLVIVSAGFDAHRADPLAALMLETGDFAWVAARICDVAGRTVSVLEGGYDLDALGACVGAYVGALMQQDASHE